MATGRSSHACAVVGQSVFVAGGYFYTDDRYLSSVEYFSLSSLTWHYGPSLPFKTNGAVLIELKGDLYHLGGTGSDAIYSLKTSSGKALTDLAWEKVGNLKKTLEYQFAALPWEKRECH